MNAFRAAASRILPRRPKTKLLEHLFRLPNYSGIDHGSTLQIESIDGFEMAFRRGTADERVLKESFQNDIYFSGVPEYQPSETDVIVDVGAHIGAFAVLAASKVSQGVVYAIEACQDTFNFLRLNAALNRASNLSVHHVALSDRRGTCTLYYDSSNWGHTVVKQLSRRGETVDCCSLQQFLADHGITKCTFIKFNCEGAEFPILLGSPVDVLRRIRMMLVLYHCDLWTTSSEQDLLSHLQASGFECAIRNRTQKRGWIFATNSTWDAE